MKNAYIEMRREIVFKYLEEYRELPSRTIARMIVRDNPHVFNDVEDARSVIRIWRGQKGKEKREKYKNRKFYTYELPITRII